MLQVLQHFTNFLQILQNFTNFLQIFAGLVLGCIEAEKKFDFGKKLQNFANFAQVC